MFSSAPHSQTPSACILPSLWATKFHTLVGRIFPVDRKLTLLEITAKSSACFLSVEFGTFDFYSGVKHWLWQRGWEVFHLREKLAEKIYRLCQEHNFLYISSSCHVLRVRFVALIELNVCKVLTRQNTTESSILPNKIYSLSQDTTAFQPIYFNLNISVTCHELLSVKSLPS
jgi:hypothetical protein